MVFIRASLIFLALGLLSSAVLARCIIPGAPMQELRKADAVFSGHVIEGTYVEDINDEGISGKRLVFTLKVMRVWKGDLASTVEMRTSEFRYENGLISMMAEDFHFEKGKEYLIYAYGEPDRLRTSACTRSRLLEKAGDDLKELGTGYEPKSEALGTSPELWAGMQSQYDLWQASKKRRRKVARLVAA